MIYLICVMRGQLDPVFSFKDEHKSEQDFKIKYNMYRYWNAVSVGYAQYLTIIPRARMDHKGERNNFLVKSNYLVKNIETKQLYLVKARL